MTIYCIVYVDEPTGLLETVATPTADMPVEGVNDEINKRIIYLTEANLPEEKCKDWAWFSQNYWFNKTILTFGYIRKRKN